MSSAPNLCAKRVIVNADDYGYRRDVNEQIAKCAQLGILSSLSLFTGADAFQHAVQLFKEMPNNIGLGIHLAIDTVNPISPPNKIPSLINQGVFLPRATVLKRLLTRRIDPKDVSTEWEAQIRKAFDEGLSLDHLDGHRHVHVFPALQQIALNLAQKYNISRIRLPKHPFHISTFHKRPFGRTILNVYAKQAAKNWHDKLSFPDYLLGFSHSGCYRQKYFISDLETIQPGQTVEAMFHPGPNNPCPWNYQWHVDAETLICPQVKLKIRNLGIQIISYKEF